MLKLVMAFTGAPYHFVSVFILQKPPSISFFFHMHTLLCIGSGSGTCPPAVPISLPTVDEAAVGSERWSRNA